MTNRGRNFNRTEIIFKFCGVLSPYLAVLLGVFVFKNGLLAVLLYHFILVVCIVGINQRKALRLLVTGFKPCLGPLIVMGGLLPGIVIYFLWPFAKRYGIDLAHVFESINLSTVSFTVFVIYSCFVNPFLEESFWRGCFKLETWLPGPIDVVFAGYHAIVMIPVVKPFFVLLSFLALAFVSWAFRTIYRLTGGLAIPLLTHIIADIAILTAVWKIIE